MSGIWGKRMRWIGRYLLMVAIVCAAVLFVAWIADRRGTAEPSTAAGVPIAAAAAGARGESPSENLPVPTKFWGAWILGLGAALLVGADALKSRGAESEDP